MEIRAVRPSEVSHHLTDLNWHDHNQSVGFFHAKMKRWDRAQLYSSISRLNCNRVSVQSDTGFENQQVSEPGSNTQQSLVNLV